MHKEIWFNTKEKADEAARIHQLKMRRSRSAAGKHYEGYYCEVCGKYHYGIRKKKNVEVGEIKRKSSILSN